MKSKLSPSDLISIIAAVLTALVSIVAISSELRDIASQMLKSELFLSVLASVLGAVAALVSVWIFYRVSRRSPSLRIFISHRHEDKSLVNKLSVSLKQKGYIVFNPDVMIKAGEKIEEKTEEIIKSSDLIILILSGPEATSQWTEKDKFCGKTQSSDYSIIDTTKSKTTKSIQDIKYLVLNNENLEKTMPTLLQAVEAHRR